jgi:hypothetical protein
MAFEFFGSMDMTMTTRTGVMAPMDVLRNFTYNPRLSIKEEAKKEQRFLDVLSCSYDEDWEGSSCVAGCVTEEENK